MADIKKDGCAMDDTVSQNIAYWNAVAKDYDHLYLNDWSAREDMEVQRRLLHMAGDVLDIGCGTGLGRRLLPGDIHSYTGVDISPAMIEQARANHSQDQFEVADAMLLPYEDARFDCVISLYGVFSHAEQPSRAVDELARVLKPGGRFLVMVYNQHALWRVATGVSVHKLAPYCSRYDGRHGSISTWFMDVTALQSYFDAWARYTMDGLSLFGNLIERPALWNIDRVLAQEHPDLCHLWIVHGSKR